MFKEGGTNIREMTKRGQKMSFHAGMVEIAAETGILRGAVGSMGMRTDQKDPAGTR